MKNMRCCHCLGLIAIATAGAQPPPGVGAQNQVFTVPPGWTRSNLGPNVILTPGSEGKNLVTLFLAGRPLAGASLRAAFEEDFQGLSRGLRIVSTSPIQSRTANNVELLAVTAELRDAAGIPSYRYYMAAGPPGRIEILVYSATSSRYFQRYWPDVMTFISGWSFANLATNTATPAGSPSAPVAAPPATPAPVGALREGRFDAIYSGLKVASASRFGFAVDTYAFFADGTVCHCLPPGGLAGFDVVAEKRASPEFVGDYQIDGDRITVTLAGGTYRRTGAFTKDRIVMEGRPYELRGDIGKLGPHPLDGVFIRAEPASADAARRFIRFTSDGQFQDQGMIESVATVQIGNGTPRPDRPSGAGRYSISRYTLTLSYADGYQRQIPIMAEPADVDKRNLTRVVVNTSALVTR